MLCGDKKENSKYQLPGGQFAWWSKQACWTIKPPTCYEVAGDSGITSCGHKVAGCSRNQKPQPGNVMEMRGFGRATNYAPSMTRKRAATASDLSSYTLDDNNGWPKKRNTDFKKNCIMSEPTKRCVDFTN